SVLCLGFSGILLGLAALCRSVLWLFPPVLALFLLFFWPERLGRRLLAMATVVLAFCVTGAPWAVRNTQLEKTFTAIDSMGGRNFMMGNYQYTPLFRAWEAIGQEGERSWQYELAQAHEGFLHTTQGQRDKLAMRAGIRFVLANPGLTFKR